MLETGVIRQSVGGALAPPAHAADNRVIEPFARVIVKLAQSRLYAGDNCRGDNGSFHSISILRGWGSFYVCPSECVRLYAATR